MANAFNSFDRNALWEPLRDHFPELGCLVWFLYGFPSQQLVPDGEGGVASIPSTVGSRQGCSLGSFLFCLALQKTLNAVKSRHPDVTVLAYADDVTLVGRPAKAVAAFQEYTKLYERNMHGELRPEKCVCYAPGLTERGEEWLRGDEVGLPTLIPVSYSGIQLLGAPVGNRLFVYQALASKCQEVVDECQLTARFTSAQLQLLLVQKSTVHRLTHLLRTIPMEEDHELSLRPPLHSVDHALRKVVDNSAFYPVSDRGWELAQRSLAVGGLGLAGPLDRADEAFVASFAHTVHYVQRHFPQFREMFPNFANPASPLQPGTQAHRALSALTRLTGLAGNDLH